MKSTILIFWAFLLSQTVAFSQNNISLMGGFEHQDNERTGWDAELSFGRQINNSRFHTEFGINYSILEYNRSDGLRAYDECGPSPLITVGLYSPPVNGYYYSSIVQYQKQQAIRLQAGVNYRIVEKSKFALSGGINFVNQFVVKTFEHGQYVLRPADCYDSLTPLYGTYARNTSNSNTSLTALLQPHLDVAYQLSSHLYLSARLSYYFQVLPRIEHARSQLNIGFSYRW